MFEARIVQGGVLKKVLEAVKELVVDANFDCTSTGITLQAMDSSHVSLIHMLLNAEGFEHYRCDRNISLGINFPSLSKIMKCASNDDAITLKAEDSGSGDHVSFVFDNKDKGRTSQFSLKLMDIDSEHLGIPETEYKAVIKMPANEFQRICRDLTVMGDTVTISATKEGVSFSVNGDMGNGSVSIKQNASVDKEDEATVVELQEPISLTFALRYLTTFAKATSLSSSVSLSLTKEAPLVVEYKIDDLGHIRYYLAPKIDDEEAE